MRHPELKRRYRLYSTAAHDYLPRRCYCKKDNAAWGAVREAAMSKTGTAVMIHDDETGKFIATVRRIKGGMLF